MSTDTRTSLLDQVEAQRSTYERMVALAQGQGGDTDDRLWLADEIGQDVDGIDETSEAAQEWLDEGPLEIVKWYRSGVGDDPDFSHVEVVICTGGPHVELNTKTRTWDGYWWSETVSVAASQAVCDYFDELVGS
jgi:hypothetical protein